MVIPVEPVGTVPEEADEEDGRNVVPVPVAFRPQKRPFLWIEGLGCPR